MSKDLERARVVAEGVGDHVQGGFSFDVFKPHAPQDLCNLIGLNWVSALDLHEKGHLSFDPRTEKTLTRTQEAELRFVGKLVVGGCCGSVLRSLLAGLKRPYAYSLERMYYDWSQRQWRLLEDTEHLEAHLEEWLNELVAWSDLSVLQRISQLVDDAVEVVASRQRVFDARLSGDLVMRGTGEGM